MKLYLYIDIQICVRFPFFQKKKGIFRIVYSRHFLANHILFVFQLDFNEIL